MKPFAIIIEWENARISELSRTRRMLSALCTQIDELSLSVDGSPEILILYDQLEIGADIIEQTLAETFPAHEKIADIRIIPTEGQRYYELKNFGVGLTDVENVIFLDSDVVPEPGWLAGLLDALNLPEVDVVGGNTYISMENLYNRAFALFWFFPLRSDATALRKADHFFANNVGFRRKILAAHPFPDLPQFRGQCNALTNQLLSNDVGIFIQERSRVEHPAPNGLKHFIVRALCEGSDEVTISLRSGHRWGTTIPSNLSRFWVAVNRALGRIRRNHSKVDMGVVGAVYAGGIAFSYIAIKFLGAAITCLKPDLIQTHFRI